MSKFSNFSSLNVNIFWCLSVQVETIRDAYMVVAGVPNKTTFHAHHICDMALDMLSSIDHLKDPSTGDNIQIRVGEQDSCQPRSGTLIISAVAGRREASSSGSATRHCLWTGRDSVSWSLFLRHLQAGLFIHSTTTTTRKYDLGILWHNRKIFCSTTEPLKKRTQRSRHWFLLVTRGHCFNPNMKTQVLPNNSLYSQLCFVRFSEFLQLRTRDRQQKLRGTNCDLIFRI